MPKVQRSPPCTPNTKMQAGPSNQDKQRVAAIDEKITPRHKRSKPDCSPKNELQTFKDEMMDLWKSWTDKQESILTKINSDMTDLKKQVQNIQKLNPVDIDSSLDFVNNRYEQIKIEIVSMNRNRAEQQELILSLQKQIEDLKKSHRSASIELRNVPCRENETVEDLTSTILETCKLLKVDMQESEVRDIYRAPGTKGSSRPIVTEFNTVTLKNRILQSVRTFNKTRTREDKFNTEHIKISGPRQPLYIAEHLHSSAVRKLFYEARNFAKSKAYKFCWTSNGSIFLRKTEGAKLITIKSEKCLSALEHIQ